MPDTLTPAPLTAERRAEMQELHEAWLIYRVANPDYPTTKESVFLELVRGHRCELLTEVDRLTHALTACQQCQAGHELDCAALTMRAEKAEAQAAGEAGPFFVGFQRRAEELQHEYFAMKQRAEKAEARVKEQQAELGSQEVQMLQLVQESSRLKDAIRAATSQQMSAAEREAYASNTNGAGTRGAFGAGEIMGRVSLAQGLLNLFDL